MSRFYAIVCFISFGLGLIPGPNANFILLASLIFGATSVIVGRIDKLSDKF